MLKKFSLIISGVMILLSILPGCSVLQKLGLIDDPKAHPVSSIVMSEDEAAKISDKIPLYVYFANPDQTKLALQVRYIPVTDAKKGSNSLATAVIKELLAGPGGKTLVKAVIPEGTKLLEGVKVDTGIATVNLSKEFIDKHPGGKTESQLTVYSIVNSLTELKDVSKVKFLIDGKAVKDFKGVFQFDAAFPRAVSLISTEVLVPNEPQDTNEAKANDEAEALDEAAAPDDAAASDEAEAPDDDGSGSGDGNVPAVNPDGETEEELLE